MAMCKDTCKNGKAIYILTVLILGGMALTFRPGMLLVNKPASSQNEFYVKGWADGCTSGANSYSLLYGPMLERPFIKDIEPGAPASKDAKDAAANAGKDHYKSGWNEGFTLCRFYQSSVYELMQFTIVVATLLFIGYLLARKKPE